MVKLETKTKLSPGEVIKRAIAFFGTGGYGLEVKEQNDTCVSFQGGGGTVDVVTCIEGKRTSVELTSQEWDRQVREFIDKLR